MESIIAAGITGAVTLMVCLISNHFQSRETRNLIEYKLSELTKRVDKHNCVIDRVYKLEQKEAVFDEQLRAANHRIEELENEIK